MAMAKPWNPMEDAYKNKNFNKYTQGPGAEFDENLQPGAMASRGGGGGGKPSTERRDERFQLCLKMVPADMTEKAILQLCGHYGQVADIKRTAKTPFVFASFATLNDMERALEGLRRDKPQGIMVDVSKHTAEKLAANPNSNSRTGSSGGGGGGGGFDRKSDKDRYSDSGSNSQPDMSKRTIKGPFANPERKPLTERKPFVTEADYQNSDLKIVDPDRQCLVERDMHDHDRNNRHNEEDDDKGGRKMYTGRAYYTDSKETTENLKRLAAGSKGSYNAEKDEFVKSSSQFNQLADEIHHCNLCQKLADKICQRCGDYYCSLDCQRKDWARHRLICFPMPQLVDPVPQLPPSNLTSPSANRPVQNNANQENRPNNMNQNQNRFQKDQSHSNFNNKNDNQNKYQKDQPQNSFNNRSNFDGKREQNSFDNRRDQTQKSFENRKDHAQNSFENRKDHAQNSFENRKDHGQNSFDNRKTQGNDMFDGKKDQVRNSFDKKPNQSNDWGTRNVSSENKKTTTESPAAAKPLPPKPVTIQRADYPKSGSPISITAVIRPNKVYIRSMLPEDNVEYVKTINLVNNEAKTAKTLTELPKKGDVVITDFHGEGFFRACVLNAESVDRIMVAYIDFGNVDFKKLSELKEIPRELIGHKRQALALFLKDVEDFEPIEKITEFMNTYVECVGKDMKLVYSDVPDKGALTGELIEISTNESFNKAIVKMRNIEPAKLSDEPVFSKDIKMKVLPPGENVELIVLDNSLIQTGAITCVLGSDLGEIDKMTAQFADYVKNTKGPYTPRPQEICLVQYDDGLWYRAECIEVVGDQNPSVLFTDFGNLTTAHIDKIRKYPKELIVPCVSITCLLAGMPEEIGKTLADRLKELIPANEKIVACKVEAVDDQTNAIHLDSVVKALKTEKLI